MFRQGRGPFRDNFFIFKTRLDPFPANFAKALVDELGKGGVVRLDNCKPQIAQMSPLVRPSPLGITLLFHDEIVEVGTCIQDEYHRDLKEFEDIEVAAVVSVQQFTLGSAQIGKLLGKSGGTIRSASIDDKNIKLNIIIKD